MTETRTARFNLPQWSDGSTDSPSRTDFNGAFSDIETRGALDFGVTASALPSTFLIDGRYFRQSYSDGWALHRLQASTWEWVGGTVVPTTVRHRAANDAAVVLGIDQGSDASRKLTILGSGALDTVGAVTSPYHYIAAGGVTPTASTTGRVYVRTLADGERGVVLRPHGSGAGFMLTAQDSGGSVVTTIDALGRLQQRSVSAFGGAALGSGATVITAPAVVADGAAGLLVHGWDNADPGIAGKSLLKVTGLLGSESLVDTTRTLIALGRAGWTGGSVTVQAPTIGLTGALGVTGATTVTGTLGATGNTTLGGTLGVTGATTLGSTLGVTGAVTAASTVTTLGASVPLTQTVAALPGTGVSNQIVWLSTEDKPYRWESGAWVKTRGRHIWVANIASVGTSPATVASWTQQVSDGIATVTGGTIKLNRAGLWTINLRVSSSATAAGSATTDLLWTGGPILYDVERSVSYRSSGGTLFDYVTWTGYVTAAQAANGITVQSVTGGGAGAINISFDYVIDIHMLGP